MEFIPKNRMLQHHPDTLMSIRKEYKLDKPGAMKDAIRILREWVEKQQHFKKKDFSDFYLETTIVGCKGSIERAKTQLDRMCTFRTLLPQYFGTYNVKTDFGNTLDAIEAVVLPKLTPDHYRVIFIKVNDKIRSIKDYFKYFLYSIIQSEYMKTHEYCRGFYAIVDFTEVNIVDILAVTNPVHFRQIFHISTQGYGMRLKGIHIFTTSKLIDTFISILKQVSSPKVAGRIYCHNSLESLPDVIPLDILPKDYGGKEPPLKEIREVALDAMSSKEHMDHLEAMNHATIDESCRLIEEFNENYAGMPGTFKMLNLD